MSPRYFIYAALILAIVSVIAYGQTPSQRTPATNDVKIRQRMGPPGGGAETVLYLKGSRMRSEMAGSNFAMTNILQCDLKRTLTINEKTKSYLLTATNGTNPGVATGEGDGGGAVVSEPAAPATAPRRDGVVNVTHTITDTGERKVSR